MSGLGLTSRGLGLTPSSPGLSSASQTLPNERRKVPQSRTDVAQTLLYVPPRIQIASGPRGARKKHPWLIPRMNNQTGRSP